MTRASGCITPDFRRRAVSAAASSRCLQENSGSPSSLLRSTMRATASERSARLQISRMRSAEIRTRPRKLAARQRGHMSWVRRAFGLHHPPGAAVAQRPASLRRLIVTVVLTVAPAALASAQGRTDVVILSNGDHITGEVVSLERGRLEFKTDDAGTLYLEWDKLTSVVTTRFVEVVAEDGRRFFGSLAKAADRTLNVAGSDVS